MNGQTFSHTPRERGQRHKGSNYTWSSTRWEMKGLKYLLTLLLNRHQLFDYSGTENRLSVKIYLNPAENA